MYDPHNRIKTDTVQWRTHIEKINYTVQTEEKQIYWNEQGTQRKGHIRQEEGEMSAKHSN